MHFAFDDSDDYAFLEVALLDDGAILPLNQDTVSCDGKLVCMYVCKCPFLSLWSFYVPTKFVYM